MSSFSSRRGSLLEMHCLIYRKSDNLFFVVFQDSHRIFRLPSESQFQFSKAANEVCSGRRIPYMTKGLPQLLSRFLVQFLLSKIILDVFAYVPPTQQMLSSRERLTKGSNKSRLFVSDDDLRGDGRQLLECFEYRGVEVHRAMSHKCHCNGESLFRRCKADEVEHRNVVHVRLECAIEEQTVA